jgi:activating signal cointegrator 1
MRVLSMTQPYASAIPLHLKELETRSWPTKYRGPVAIQAAKTWPLWCRTFAAVEHKLGRLPARLPLGAIICVAEITDCRPTEEVEAEGLIGPIERLYGDYSPGRFAWHMEKVVAFPEEYFIPCRGMLGLWRPDEKLLAAIVAATEKAKEICS